jgi:hypothetical protein
MTPFNDQIDIVRRLSEGTYFYAYEAFDRLLERSVFLKVARPASDEVSAEIVEAHVALWRRLAQAKHPGMPAIFSLGRQDGRPFLITEWLGKQSLRELLDESQLQTISKTTFLVPLLRRCLVVLGDLHESGLTHGDINPGNILVGKGWEDVFLVDPAPSLAGVVASDHGGKLILANPAFTAPEVLAGEPITPGADLFALGAVLAAAAMRVGVSPPPVINRMSSLDPKDRVSSVDEAVRLLFEWEMGPKSQPSVEVKAAPVIGASSSEWQSSTQPFPASRSPWDMVSAAFSVPVPQAEREKAAVPADFLVVAPALIEPARHFVVELWVGPSGQHAAMANQATRRARMIERDRRSHIDPARDTLITVVMQLPDFELATAVETLGWQGDTRSVGFMVKASSNLKPGIYPGSAKLMQGLVPFATIWFDLEVGSATASTPAPSAPLNARVQRIARAFASYASQDRSEVLRRVQGIQAAGTEVFLDIVSLRSGEDWERVLYREINTCDGFFLFWSRNARESEWVEREWRYALEQRGLTFINPLALEDPRLAAPPTELGSKHFNDMLLAFIAQEEALRRGQ